MLATFGQHVRKQVEKAAKSYQTREKARGQHVLWTTPNTLDSMWATCVVDNTKHVRKHMVNMCYGQH